MWRAIASNTLTLAILAMLVLAGLIAWGRQEFVQPGPLAQSICFKVESGDSLSKVSRVLEEQGAVSDARIFRIAADYGGKGRALKVGSYLIPANAPMSDVLEALTTAGQSTCGREVNFRIAVAKSSVVLRELDPATNRYREVVAFDPATEAAPSEYLDATAASDMRYRVTLAEGVTSWQVVDALKRAEFLEGTPEGLPPEGSLAPDSYEVIRGASRVDLLVEMAARQTASLDKAWAERAPDLPYKTKEEALVMASIVEKETGVAEERRQVASVFVNRLRLGMKLQTDPTVIYGVTKGEGVLGRGLRQSELRRETPYNTYVIDGLPPGPIANPGVAAIEAALNPDTTDYLFFVADGTGGHAFAETLEKHNENVARWRQIEKEQAAEGVTGVQGN
jgi:UPF0755 protein